TSHGRLSGPVCGQDPRTCLEPLSLPGDPNAWPDDVSRWPPCHRQQTLSNNNSSNALLSDDLAHLLCSQVNCMSETCGMLGVADPQQPNQFYRVLTSLFLHSGLITLAVTLVHHLLFLRKLEQSLGWHRTAFIYLGSGVVGNLVSMIFLPYLVDVGPTSAQIGSLAPILIELGMSWSHYESKVRPLCLFFLSPLVLILFGFFPWFDNFANLGGLASGLLLSVVLMPYVSYGSSPNAVMLCRRISVAICLNSLVAAP
uniref:Rhomboid domain-containing protein n=1 Tax=Macrostomum lignano TaxID=282301 RepID=A0A1I8H3A3_9PLAT